MSLVNCCNPIVFETQDCGFCRLIKTKDLKGSEVELINIKKNNIDCCRCPEKKELLICKDNKKQFNKIRRRQIGKKYWFF